MLVVGTEQNFHETTKKEQKKDEQEDDNIGFEPAFFSETILGELGSSSPQTNGGIKISKLSDHDHN